MKRITTIGLACLAVCALSAVSTGSASAWCRHVKTGELSLYEFHGWFGCTGVLASKNGFVKTSNYSGTAVAGEPGIFCYRVQSATQPSSWKNNTCTVVQEPGEGNKGGFVKIEAGTKTDEELVEGGEGPPEVSLLAGEKLPVTITGTGGASTFETAAGSKLTCTAQSYKGELTTSTSGTSAIDLTGCKSSKVGCASESEKAEKDPMETVLVASASLRLVSTENTESKELNDGLAMILPAALKINCAGVKDEIHGAVTGLVGLVNKQIGASEAVLLEFSQEKGKQLAGKCIGATKECEKLLKEPLEAKFGEKFEAAGLQGSAEISFSKMVVIKT